MTRRAVLAAAAASAISLALAPGAARAQSEEGGSYLLATASTGGTYFPVGVAIATLTAVKLTPSEEIVMSAINSAGSGENVRLLREGEAQFAILQGLFGLLAREGRGPFEATGPETELRSISMLWRNVEQVVLARELAGTGTIEDLLALDGDKIALGQQASGAIVSNRTWLANLGVDADARFDLFHAGYGPSIDALQNGQVVATSTPAGPPTGAVSRLFAAAADRVTPLEFTPEQAAAADGGMGLWTPFTIPAGTYPGLDRDWSTIAQPNFLAVRADVPDEHVYMITKTIYENLPFLNAIHQATTAMHISEALTGLPAPLHPGAARYYREAGLEIPPSLLAE